MAEEPKDGVAKKPAPQVIRVPGIESAEAVGRQKAPETGKPAPPAETAEVAQIAHFLTEHKMAFCSALAAISMRVEELECPYCGCIIVHYPAGGTDRVESVDETLP